MYGSSRTEHQTSSSMKAVVITKAGGPEVLALRDIPDPQPGAHEVLVRVRAAGLNRADILQREGRYPAPPGAPQDIPGLEFAGEVAELGQQVQMWRPGQRVFGIAAGGCQAEFIVAHERMLAEIPPNLGWGEAAAVPEAFITAHDALWKQAKIVAGESVLIHAVGSGVGVAAVQLVRAAGALPYGSSRTQQKIQRAAAFGLEDGVVLAENTQVLVERCRKWTAGRGFDVVLDLVGGDYVPASIEVLGKRGRLMLLATARGRKSQIDLALVMGKRLQIIGSVLRARSLEEKIAVTEAFAAEVVPLLAEKKVRPGLDSEFDFTLQDIRTAYRRVESNESFGKVVLRVAKTE